MRKARVILWSLLVAGLVLVSIVASSVYLNYFPQLREPALLTIGFGLGLAFICGILLARAR